jgi:hypothetical protein
MKQFLLLFSLFCALGIFAQAPQGINYQAVIRNVSGVTVNNQLVRLKMRILQGSTTGTQAYAETFQVTTSSLGLVNVVLGQGTVLAGTFSTINWATGPYFLEVSADATGGTNFSLLGTQQLVSVPYALYAFRHTRTGR